VIQTEIEPAEQGQTLIAIEWAIDSSSRLIASWAPVFGRSSTVSQDAHPCRQSRTFVLMRLAHMPAGFVIIRSRRLSVIGTSVTPRHI
jgi:hypothetical protein